MRTLESVAHWYTEKAKLKIHGEWNKIHDVNGNAYIISVISSEGQDRVHVRFEIGGQKAWVTEWGRGSGAAKAGQRNTQKLSNGVADLRSRNPYLKDYLNSAQYNPVRKHFNKAGEMEIYRRLNDRPYTDLDGKVIAHGSLNPKVLEPGYKPPKTGKKGRPKEAKSIAKLPQDLGYKAKHIVKNQLLLSIGVAQNRTEETAAKCLYDYMASCAVNRVCDAIEKAGGKRV
jgi:hypothetical protein